MSGKKVQITQKNLDSKKTLLGEPKDDPDPEPKAMPDETSIKNVISSQAINNDKSLLTMLIYLIVAEFGVFSSPTLSAPNIQVGMIFFFVFIIATLIFSKLNYKSSKVAAFYFIVIFVVGLTLSFILGLFWGKSTIIELLSLDFFKSDSLVALITGMGVSLFAGSRS